MSDQVSSLPDRSSLDGLLEPATKNASAARDNALTSLAISMKRIADALDGTALGVDISESLAGVTNELTRHRP